MGLGAQQVCLTTHHTGGFALWPTKASNYSVLASPFGKTGRDILKEFVTSMRKHGLEPCFYVNLPWDAAEWHDSEQHYIDVQGLRHHLGPYLTGYPCPAPLLTRRAACSSWWPCV